MSPIILAAGAGFTAGAMNALAGGGSFVSLPALLAVGVPSVQANATSTVALFPGTVTSTWAYRHGLGPVGPASLRSLLITTVFGGIAGACLLLSTSSETFDFLLPWLLLLATVALMVGSQVGAWLRERHRIGPGTVLIVQFCLAVYGGYFGGAVGIMMVAVWSLLDGERDIKSLNGPRMLLVSAANVMAVFIFIAARAVVWHYALTMLIGSMLGGYAGAAVGRRANPKIVRAGTLLLTACITLAFFVKVYMRPRSG
jgi:uncharacterized membrane protein YfcA